MYHCTNIISIILYLIFTATTADNDSIKFGLQKFQNATNLDRNLLTPYMAINDYACWCFFGQYWRKGKGKPENEIDGHVAAGGLVRFLDLAIYRDNGNYKFFTFSSQMEKIFDF